MYLDDMKRKKEEREYEGPKKEFLASLDIQFIISEAKRADLERAEELIKRTNQLNTTGKTYSYDELKEFRIQLSDPKVNPMTLKMRLAGDIITQFHGKQAVEEAAEHFDRVFRRGEVPEDSTTFEMAFPGGKTGKIELPIIGKESLAQIIVKANLVKSSSEAKRLLSQGAIEVDGKKITDNVVAITAGSVIRVGKRRFLKIINRNA